MKKSLLLFAFLLCSFHSFIQAQHRYHTTDAIHQPDSTLISKQAANFKVVSLQGDTLELDQLKGKVVVLNFWFSTCTPCLREIPYLNHLVEKYGKEKVAYLAVSVNDSKEELQFFLDFLKDPARNRRIPYRSFDFVSIPDANEQNIGIARNLYGVTYYPTTYIIDQQGKIVLMTDAALGANSSEEADELFDEKLAKLLGGE